MSNVVRECIARAGYGTVSYNHETGDCLHENYAGVEEVISGDWGEYDSCMSEQLAKDFRTGFNFDRHRLKEYSDGRRSSELMR